MELQTATIWERRPEETSKAWAAFQIYRSLPSQERSLVECYVEYRRLSDPGFYARPRTAPGYFQKWSRSYDWLPRAHAYDARQDVAFLEVESSEHILRLRSYRDRLQKYSELATINAIRCMRTVNRSLEALEKDGGVVSPNLLPKYIGATARLQETAAEAEGKALAVDRILEMVDDGSTQVH